MPTAAKVSVPEMRHASQLALAWGEVGSGSDEEEVALVKVEGMKADPISLLQAIVESDEMRRKSVAAVLGKVPILSE